MLKIIKGLPASFLVILKDGDNQINLNDGSWNITATMHYQTQSGKSPPWPLTIMPSSNGVTISFDSMQTEDLIQTDSGYIIKITIVSTSMETTLQTNIRIPVLDEL